MDWIVSALGWTTFALIIIGGLGLNVVGLFGNWLILAAMGGAWVAYGFAPFGWMGVGGMLLLAILGEVLETLFAGLGARKFGGSKGAMWAALVGTLLGAIFGTPFIPVPIIGTLIGACAGAFAGAAIYEYLQQDAGMKQSVWVGTGAALGKVGGILAKFTCGLLMLAVGWFTWS